jgi:hypothetical protein
MTDDERIRSKRTEIEVMCLDKTLHERTFLAISFVDMSIDLMRKMGKSDAFIDDFLEETMPVVYDMFRTTEGAVDAVASGMEKLLDEFGEPLTFSMSHDGCLYGRPLQGGSA